MKDSPGQSAPEKNNHSTKLAVINGLRGVAILAVIFHHLPIHAWVETRFPMVSNTFAGVNLFFILSGFVLYLPYLRKNKQTLTVKETGAFYRKRFYRIYPLFFINCLTCLLIFNKPTEELAFSAFGALSTYSLFFGTDFLPVINWVLWSLMMEVWFSILFPPLLGWIYKSSILKVGVFVIVVSLIARYLMVLYNNELGSFLNLLSRMDDFIIGLVLAHLYVKSELFHKLKKELMALAGITFLLFACFMQVATVPPILKIFQFTLFQAGFGLIILSLLSGKTWLTILFENKLLQTAGMMCFSLYVWHGVLIHVIIRKEFHGFDYAIYIPAVIIISLITYRFIEFRKETSLKNIFPFL